MNDPGQSSSLLASDGHRIPLYTWSPPHGNACGIVHICHGMAEHGGRYAELAAKLVATGWTTVAHDHRGHGRNLVLHDQGIPGHFADHDGWRRVTEDVGQVQQMLRETHPGAPIVLMGHSMGALIVQDYLGAQAAFWPDAVVLSGPSRDSRVKLRALQQIIRLETWRLGPRRSSPIINLLTFGEFSRSVKGHQTPFDWLSTDPAEVQAYIDDPLCGFECTAGLWQDLAHGLIRITAPNHFADWPNPLPVYILAGGKDPVGAFGKGPQALAQAMRNEGLDQVALKLYPLMRHETFHERDRAVVIEDLKLWLQEVAG